MTHYRKTMGSAALSGMFDLPLELRDREVEVIILPKDAAADEAPKQERRLHFVDAPPFPESFFDPLPEEELQAWGL